MLVAAASLAFLVATGFDCTSAVPVAPLRVGVVCAVTLLVLGLLSSTKTSALAGVVIVPLLTTIVVFVSAQSRQGAMFADEAGNFTPILLSSIVVTVIVFLLTRKRTATVVFAALGTLVVGYVQFIYHEGHVLAVVCFYLALIVLVGYGVYRQSVQPARPQLATSAKALAPCMLVAVVVAALGVGVHAAVIAPLDPPSMEVKLIREYVALPTVQMKGVANTSSTKDESKRTSISNDDTEYSSTQGKDSAGSSEGQQDAPENGHAQERYDSQADTPGFTAITHEVPVLKGPWWILIVVLLAAALIGGKFALRRRKVSKLFALSPFRRVAGLYRFWLKRIKRLGLPEPGCLTPTEYASSLSQHWNGFAAPDGTDFTVVSSIFSACSYGGRAPSAGELAQLESFQNSFYANCREHLGLPKYLLKFFIL